MKNNVWVVEITFSGKWTFHIAFESRSRARSYTRRHFVPGVTRIRKYIPA